MMVERRPHAVMDLASRTHKAIKIERVLGLVGAGRTLRVLEVGTGSGGIAAYFARHPALDCSVDAVDVNDQRLDREGYRFSQVEGVGLPFDDATFDVIISNHVIEHVGERDSQLAHLMELRRVMKSSGVGYLAVPSRWMLIEPHYRLAFLSWWPKSWRSAYLRMMRRGDFYDCEPLSRGDLDALLRRAGWDYEHAEVAAMRVYFELEGTPNLFKRAIGLLPDAMLALLGSAFPTQVRILRHGSSQSIGSSRATASQITGGRGGPHH